MLPGKGEWEGGSFSAHRAAASSRGFCRRLERAEVVTFSAAVPRTYLKQCLSFTPTAFSPQLETMARMEVKTSLLDNMIGVGDMVLLEPLSEETFINNLKKRFDHSEIYVSVRGGPWGG